MRSEATENAKVYRHWKRRGESLVLTLVEGEAEGRGRRGRRRMEWMTSIITSEGPIQEAHRNELLRAMATQYNTIADDCAIYKSNNRKEFRHTSIIHAIIIVIYFNI